MEATTKNPGVQARGEPARGTSWALGARDEARLKAVVDVLMLILAVVATIVVTELAGPHSSAEIGMLVGYPCLVMLFLYLRGTYRSNLELRIVEEVWGAVSAVSVAALVLLAVQVFVEHSRSGELAARVWLLTLVAVGGGRLALALVLRGARREGHIGHPTLIVGAGVVGAKVATWLEQHPESGLRVEGFLDADPMPSTDIPRVPILGTPDDLEKAVAETRAEHVILAYTTTPDEELIPLVRRCGELGLQVSVVPRLFESVSDHVALDRLGTLPLLDLRPTHPKGSRFAIKHGLERVVAAVCLVIFGPLMLLIALGVKLGSPGPVLFRQGRVGRDGRPFDMLKFRTMSVDESGEGGSSDVTESFELEEGVAPGGVEGVDRRTRLGRWLRRSSLDELPQLINVVRGEMSLGAGPRPERPEFVRAFEPEVDRYGDRHRVRAGITGAAQVRDLRGQTSISDRVEWDNYYIENWSLSQDLKILLSTLPAMFRGPEPGGSPESDGESGTAGDREPSRSEPPELESGDV